NTNISLKNIEKLINKLKGENQIIEFTNGNVKSYLHIKNYNSLKEEILKLLNNFHQKYSLRIGYPKEELRKKIFINLNKKEFDQLISNLKNKNKIKTEGSKLALKEFEIKYNSRQKEIKNSIIDIFKDNFMPPTKDEIPVKFDNEKEALEVFQAIVNESLLKKVDHKLYFHRDTIDKAEELLKNYLKENKSIELSEFRDLLESSRKYALPLLEYFDQKDYLVREGDKRKLNKQ
ncbi:MAG: SelB C-terminal domain-containing protein, partial [Bacillota bacterium]